MISSNTLIFVCLAYVTVLFAVAALADNRAQKGQLGWLRSPLVYTLSLSVYCTGWTFYGAVGSAARNGLEFAAIYIGPTLLFVGWWWLLRKLVRIGREHRITSLADLISSRYGKSNTLGVLVTLLAVISSTPYIALQLQSITASFAVLTQGASTSITGFWIAVGLAIFTILFGTRNVDANERHYGVVTAIAVEAIVKLIALVAVGLFVVFGVFSGPADILAHIPEGMLKAEDGFGARWASLTFLAAVAILCTPRMFQVAVVENIDEKHLATASWAFPTYLFLISLFVLPIAIGGLTTLEPGSNPDMFVLTIPLTQGQSGLTLLAFLGGFSAATSMVIVSAIALATMVSNHITVPLFVRMRADEMKSSGDVRGALIFSRRVSIAVILALGYLYFQLTGGTNALASIGLIAFLGLAQFLPAILGGIFWRSATRTGAATGMIAGSLIWAYTLFLPSFEGGFVLSASTISNGLWDIAALRPQALFGLSGLDPLVHALFWSLTINTTLFLAISLMTTPSTLERLQSALFIDVFRTSPASRNLAQQRSATSEDLFTLAQRILGGVAAHRLFAQAAERQGKGSGLPDPTDDFILEVERNLAGSIGGASANAMVSQIAGGTTTFSVDGLMEIAGETAQIMRYSSQLERQSLELEKTAEQLRFANEELTKISADKDAFLSQVSHELRTPMTSIRSFAEILREPDSIAPDQLRRFVGIIGEESQRLTRLLDEILDLSFLESGQSKWDIKPIQLNTVINHAIDSTEALRAETGTDVTIAQTNAVKYGAQENGRLTLTCVTHNQIVTLSFSDNGPGIAPEDHDRVFDKFARFGDSHLAGSAGLGLPISREIMRNLGGDLTLAQSDQGAEFCITLTAA